MDNVKFVDFEQNGETVTHAIIDNGDGSITSMYKSYYEAQQVEHLTESVVPPTA